MNVFNFTDFSIDLSVGKGRISKEKSLIRKLQPFFYKWLLFLYRNNFEIPDDKYKKFFAYLNKIIQDILIEAYVYGASQSATGLLKTLGFDTKVKAKLENQNTVDLLNNRALVSTGHIIEYLFRTKGGVQRYIDTGDTQKERLILAEEKSKNDAKWKTSLIVTREFSFAFNRSRYDVFFNSGVTRKRWICVKDDRVRPKHQLNESIGWMAIEKKFPSKSLFPGELDIDSYGCRCIIEPDITGIFEEEDVWTDF